MAFNPFNTYLKGILVRCLNFIIRISVKKTDITGYDKVVILAPHPDDEVLGLGGVVLKLRVINTKITIIYLTDGEGSDVWQDINEIKRDRISLSEKVCTKLGINNADIYRLHLPDGSVPHARQPGFEDSVKRVKEIIDFVKPDAVFATHNLDYWPFDHVACAEIAFEAVKQSKKKPELWYFWVWAWYNLKPRQLLNFRFNQYQRIDISGQVEKKRELMDIYLNSFTPDGKPWIGKLPSLLIKALNNPFEILEKEDYKDGMIVK